MGRGFTRLSLAMTQVTSSAYQFGAESNRAEEKHLNQSVTLHLALETMEQLCSHERIDLNIADDVLG